MFFSGRPLSGFEAAKKADFNDLKMRPTDRNQEANRTEFDGIAPNESELDNLKALFEMLRAGKIV